MSIGLVLSGGMMKGAYQIGALRAIGNYIPQEEIKYISCASIGALNGYAFATNNLETAAEIWEDFCGRAPKSFIGRVLRSGQLDDYITCLTASAPCIAADFYIALLDITRKAIVYKNLGNSQILNTYDYLRASIALPAYNRAVCIENAAYYDGAMIDNIPIYPLLNPENMPDMIIVMYFDDIPYIFEDRSFEDRIVKIRFPSNSILGQSLTIKPGDAKTMICTGYEITDAILNEVLKAGYGNTEYTRKTTELINQRYQNTRLRITGDVIVANLNRFTQRFLSRTVER